MTVDLRKFKKTEIGGLTVVDVRCAFPDLAAPCPFTDGGLWPAQRFRDPYALVGVVIHNDGVFFAEGDKNYDGSTLDEDAQRLNAIYQQGLTMGWGGMPYHAVASPNQGALYLCRDWRTFGAHVEAKNHQYVGVAIMGEFNGAMPSARAICGAARGVAVLRYLTITPETPTGRALPILGHRDLMSTDCPGATWPTWKWTLAQWANLQEAA